MMRKVGKPDQGAAARVQVQVQVQVQAADAQGRRAFSLHSLDEASSARSGGWILHAMGVLAGAEAAGREAAAVPLLAVTPSSAVSSAHAATRIPR